MPCGFFLDTGVIRGLCDKLDPHNQSCEFFFNKYPIEIFEYVIPTTVIDELNYYKHKLTKDVSCNPLNKIYFTYIRQVQQYIDLYISQMTHFECPETEKIDLNNVIVNIQPIIGFDSHNKRNDIQITGEAIIWSINSNKTSNSLITVDKYDIYRNKNKIIRSCEKKLNCSLQIYFVYLPEYFKLNFEP